LGSEFDAGFLTDDAGGGHGGDEADDRGPRVSHERFGLSPEVVNQESENGRQHRHQQGRHVLVVSVLGKPCQKPKCDDGISPE